MTTYGLTRKGSNHILDYGSKSQICSQWAEIKYRFAPDEEYSVKELDIRVVKELTTEQIEKQIEDDYDKVV